MQFQVPQFIDVEDRIFGPLTLRQFLFLAGAGAGSFFLFFLLTTKVWIGLTVLLFAIAAALAFVKINGQTLPVMAGYVLRYFWTPKFYLWRYSTNMQNSQPMIHDLPAPAAGQASPLQKLLLKFHAGTQGAQPPATEQSRQSS